MSTDKFIITKEDSNFVTIPNAICQKLKDAEAIGLYVYLVSLPPQWEFYKAVIRKHFNWGRDKLEKKLSVLREHNLIEPVPDRNEKGQFVGWNLHVKNGRDFVYPVDAPLPEEPETHNTENPCSGKLSTDLNKNSTQNTEKPAAGKPGTGFSTPIKDIDTKEKDFRKKSFCADAQKKRKSKSYWRQNNAKVHSFAEAKNQVAANKEQMENEARHIEEHEVIKRSPMPEPLRELIKNMKTAH